MRLSAMFGSSSATIGATAVGAIALVAGALGFTVFNAPDDAPEDQPIPSIAAEAPLPDTITVAAAPDTPEDAMTLEPPRLDLVRVDAAGETVVAGQTSADLTVAILLDGAQVAVTQSDGAGDFVSLLTLPPSASPRTLTVEAWPEDAPVLAGLETVFIAPVAEVTPDPEPVLDPEPVTVAAVIDDAGGAEPTDVAAEVVPEAAPNAEDVAVAVPDLLPDSAPTDVPVEPVLAEPTEDVALIEDVAPIEEVAPIEDVAIVPGDPQDPLLPEQEIAPVATPDPVEGEVVDVAATQPASDAPTPPAPTTAPTTLTAPVLSAAPITPASLTGPAQPQLARAEAPAIVISGPEGLRVVQSPTPEPEVQTTVRLDAISYDAEGQVILAGRGPVAADIQVYLNNQPIQLGEIGPGGAWSLQLPDVDPGTYTLAVAELAEDGSTASRIETPFLREDPDRVAEAPVAQAAGIDVITVQPGFTLWGIARDTFGDGVLYVQIFEENQEQIDDPNWIFPGQIFRLPDVDQPNREN